MEDFDPHNPWCSSYLSRPPSSLNPWQPLISLLYPRWQILSAELHLFCSYSLLKTWYRAAIQNIC